MTVTCVDAEVILHTSVEEGAEIPARPEIHPQVGRVAPRTDVRGPQVRTDVRGAEIGSPRTCSFAPIPYRARTPIVRRIVAGLPAPSVAYILRRASISLQGALRCAGVCSRWNREVCGPRSLYTLGAV